MHNENSKFVGRVKFDVIFVIVYCLFVVFYVTQAIVQISLGYLFYPSSAVVCIIFNIIISIIGLYGYLKNKNERWILQISVFILPLAMLGLIANFHSLPIVISSIYIAITCKCNKILKWCINSLCLLPIVILLVITLSFPIGILILLDSKNTVSEIYSPNKKYVAIISEDDLGATGGSVSISAGKYLDMGILGKYLPNRSLVYGGYGIDRDVNFVENENKVLINGKPYFFK